MREEALEILFKYLETDRMRKHCYAVEAVMRDLAKRLEPEKEEEWAVAGLLHDLDSDIVGRKPGEICEGHATTTVELLKKKTSVTKKCIEQYLVIMMEWELQELA